MALIAAFVRILENPTIGGAFNELMLHAVPVWIAFLVGLVIGWVWKPKWANAGRDIIEHFISRIVDFSIPSSQCKMLTTPSPVWSGYGSAQTFSQSSSGTRSCSASSDESRLDGREGILSCRSKSSLVRSSSSSQLKGVDHDVVNDNDLRHLAKLVEVKDGGPSWIPMMDRSTKSMGYRAWRRDPPTGPPQYRSSTIFEDATPEMVKDFFWDDEFRLQWDDMLIHAKTLEECNATGTMMVQWIRKFPFFCSDREYVIGRRMWASERAYYCVTKGVPCSMIPRRDKPRRVDLYYSSWCIRPVESRRGDGLMSSCEVLLFHHEDMGIPWEIAKLGVRQGMWGAVKKIEPGLRLYQRARAHGEPISRSAFMASIYTKVSPDYIRSLLSADDGMEGTMDGPSGAEEEDEMDPPQKLGGFNVPKLLVLGGAVALACSLDQGLLTKAVIFGLARRFGRRLE